MTYIILLMPMSSRAEIGQLGEELAARYLGSRGYAIIGRNYRKKWGELDLIAQRGQNIHFVEVKSVSREIVQGSVTRETYRPEENVHPQKLKRMHRAIETYLAEKNINAEWMIDVVTVEVDMARRVGKCRLIENVL